MAAAGSTASSKVAGQQRSQVNPILLAHAAAITAMTIFMMWAFTNYRLVPYRCAVSICIQALSCSAHHSCVGLCAGHHRLHSWLCGLWNSWLKTMMCLSKTVMKQQLQEAAFDSLQHLCCP